MSDRYYKKPNGKVKKILESQDADNFFVKLGWAEVDKDGNDLKKVSKKKVSKIKKVSKKTKK